MGKLSNTFLGSALIAHYLLLGGCSSLLSTQDTGSSAEKHNASKSLSQPQSDGKKKVHYTIRPGDTLSNIAQRVTGNSSNWRKIAKHNNISNPARLSVGQKIVIPEELIVPMTREAIDSGNVQSEKDFSSADSNNEKLSTSSRKTKETKILDSGAGWIIIRGSYYPREVTREPDTISEIVTQVWPGTRLRYVERVEGWFKVITERGPGYINPDYAFIER